MEILQRLKDYKKAVEVLEEMVNQNVYCSSRRFDNILDFDDLDQEAQTFCNFSLRLMSPAVDFLFMLYRILSLLVTYIYIHS